MKISVIFGAGTAGKSYVVTRQRRLNCYFENRADGDKTRVAAYGTPGMKPLFTIGALAHPVRGWIATPSFLFAVIDSFFYQVTPTGTTQYFTTIGSVLGNVSLAQNPTQIAVVDGSSGYIFNLGAGILVPISSGGFPAGCKTIAFIGGYFVAEIPGTQLFAVSNFYDGTIWPGLGQAAASYYEGKLLAVDNLIGQLLLFSTTHLEFWQLGGSAPQPFLPIQAATVEYGIAAIFSRAHVANSICFLARSPQGGLKVCRINGYQVDVISDPDHESIFATFSRVDDAVGLSYDIDNHPMYQLTFPTANRSFLFDLSTGIPSETQTGLTAAYAARHTGNFSVFFNSQQLISDYKTNQVYVPDAGTYTDNGVTIPRRIITRHQLRDFNEFSIDEAYIDMETGVGITQSSSTQSTYSVGAGQNSNGPFFPAGSGDGYYDGTTNHGSSTGNIAGNNPAMATIAGAHIAIMGWTDNASNAGGPSPAYVLGLTGTLAQNAFTSVSFTSDAGARNFQSSAATFVVYTNPFNSSVTSLWMWSTADNSPFNTAGPYVWTVTTGSTTQLNPTVQLSCSKDNGRTWLTPRTKQIGFMGQYSARAQRAIWRRWGSARVFTFDLLMTDPVKFVATAGALSTRERPQ